MVVALLTSCGGGDKASSHSPPPVRYALAAHGLPTDGIWKSTPAVVDINKDGILDVAALPRLGRGARVWFGNDKGLWTEVSTGLEMPASCGGGIAVGDVNRDGHLDLAVADHCEGVFVYLGDGAGHWHMVTESLNPALSQQEAVLEEDKDALSGAEDLALGDVNEDGMLDLVVAASNEGGFTVYLGDGSGETWKEVTNVDGLPSGSDPEADDQEKGGWANRVLLTDVNGDAHLDVVASYYAGPRVWRGDGKGRWLAASEGLSRPQAGGLFRGLAVGDINKDGRVDLVVANVVKGPEIYIQQADGTWHLTPSPAFSLLPKGVDSVALGDLTRDGHLDLVVAGRREQQEHSGLFVFRGNGKAAWTPVEGTQLPTEGVPFVWGITLGDMNRDGELDIVATTGLKLSALSGGPAKLRFAATKELSGRQGSAPTQTPIPQQPRLQVWINKAK